MKTKRTLGSIVIHQSFFSCVHLQLARYDGRDAPRRRDARAVDYLAAISYVDNFTAMVSRSKFKHSSIEDVTLTIDRRPAPP